MQRLWQDLRYGARTLLKKPGFALIAIITLSLGIGANTAIFSVINTVLLKSLPYKDGDRLVAVWLRLIKVDQVELSPNEMADLRERSRVLAQLAASERANLNLTGNGDPVRLEGQAVTANLFPVLGVVPLLGRTFTAEEDKAKARVAVLSYGLWQKRLGGKPDAVGKTIMLDGKNFEVIGVMPSEFQFPPPGTNSKPGEIWVPRSLETERQRDAHNLFTIGQLASGATFAQARAEMESIARQRQLEDTRRQGTGFNPVPLQAQVGKQLRPSLLILAGAVGFVLLIACANVANLLLASACARRKEISIRLAMGASRWRIVRQLLTESLLLSLVGGGVGLLLAVWGSEAIRLLGADQIPRADQITVDGSVLGFTLLLSVLTGAIFGLAPALQASHADLNATLKEGGRIGGGGRRGLRSALVVAEVALSLMLLVGAGLLIKNFWQLLHVDPGFNPQNLLSVELSLASERYAEESQRLAFYQQLLERVSTLPGVQSAAVVNHPPFSGRRGIDAFKIEGRPDPKGMEDTPLADFRAISPNYFQMMSIPVLQGRSFSETETKDAPQTVIVNRAFAERYWPGENPLGRRLDNRAGWMTVVGVVGDIHQSGLDEEAAPHVYAPFLQTPLRRSGLLLRTSADPLSLVASVRNQVLAVDPAQPIYNVHTMEDLIAGSMAQRRLNLVLLAVFAATALLLAAVGIYGVISYSVTQRTHEIGIRLALGAQTPDVLKLIVKQGMTPVALGIAVGIAGALALSRVMSNLLYGISANDPLTFAAIALLLALVALLACYVPARRATKVDPMVALHYE